MVKDWGYASIVKSKDKEYLFITEIGNDACKKYDNDGACLAIFREQIKKYQLPFSLEDDKKNTYRYEDQTILCNCRNYS